MNARISTNLPALGATMEGGFFHGVMLIDGQLWGEVTAPKASGDIAGHVWLPEDNDVPSAKSDFDGLVNTRAMADAGSPLAKAILALRIDGHEDWYLPARGGQLLQWANLQQRLDDSERLERAWYWSSTQYSRGYAYFQYFDNGNTYDDVKGWKGGRARAVRRFLIG